MGRYDYLDFGLLKGVILKGVFVSTDNREIDFICADGRSFRLFHSQDCCECVTVEDVAGDLNDLVGSPLLVAEVVSYLRNETMPEGLPSYEDESFSWTFYKLSTIKGSVTIRWYGSSNGYYSESVEFIQVDGDD